MNYLTLPWYGWYHTYYNTLQSLYSYYYYYSFFCSALFFSHRQNFQCLHHCPSTLTNGGTNPFSTALNSIANRLKLDRKCPINASASASKKISVNACKVISCATFDFSVYNSVLRSMSLEAAYTDRSILTFTNSNSFAAGELLTFRKNTSSSVAKKTLLTPYFSDNVLMCGKYISSNDRHLFFLPVVWHASPLRTCTPMIGCLNPILSFTACKLSSSTVF